ncbi:MAG: helix-turn-helix domain-containing protein [Trebonia sp.]
MPLHRGLRQVGSVPASPTRGRLTAHRTPPEGQQAGGAGSIPRARPRYAATCGGNVAGSGQTLAALLRQLRAEHGLSVRRLAERAVVDRRTVQRLERGQLRPRPSTLARIAGALDPDRRTEIRAQLVAAAGENIAADSAGWSRYATARIGEALRAGRVPFPAAHDRAVRLSVASEQMFAMSMKLTDAAAAAINKPGSRFRDLMNLSNALDAEYELLGKEVGSIWHATPPRRYRGDPVDVSPYPPPLGDLRAVWQWLWEWRVREGRLRPRSARERAIAETGARERQKVREAPAPPRKMIGYGKDGT